MVAVGEERSISFVVDHPLFFLVFFSLITSPLIVGGFNQNTINKLGTLYFSVSLMIYALISDFPDTLRLALDKHQHQDPYSAELILPFMLGGGLGISMGYLVFSAPSPALQMIYKNYV